MSPPVPVSPVTSSKTVPASRAEPVPRANPPPAMRAVVYRATHCWFPCLSLVVNSIHIIPTVKMFLRLRFGFDLGNPGLYCVI